MLLTLRTGHEVEKCSDDHTPVWPDADYQNVDGLKPERVSSDCRRVVCSDNIMCIHVYYTLDGSTPTRNSRLYHGPFLIDTTTPVTTTVVQDLPFAFITVKAIAVQEGNLDSGKECTVLKRVHCVVKSVPCSKECTV